MLGGKEEHAEVNKSSKAVVKWGAFGPKKRREIQYSARGMASVPLNHSEAFRCRRRPVREPGEPASLARPYSRRTQFSTCSE